MDNDHDNGSGTELITPAEVSPELVNIEDKVVSEEKTKIITVQDTEEKVKEKQPKNSKSLAKNGKRMSGINIL